MATKRTCERCRSACAWAVAVAASAALHLALLALLPRDGGAPAPRPVVAFEVELRPAPAPTRAVAPAAPPRSPGTSAPVAPPEPASPGPARPRARGNGLAAGPRAAPGAAAGPEAWIGDAREGLEIPPARASPDLRVRPSAPAPGAGDGVAVDALATDRLREWSREQAGRARVESGAIDPYLRDVGRELVRSWDAERLAREGGLSRYLAEAGENLVAFGRVWQRLAEGFAKTGSPGLIDGGSERMKELSGLPAGPAREALVAREIQRQLRPAFSEGHVALVRVTQALTGSLLSVELVSPSKDGGMDRAALEAVRAAVQKLPAPPGAALTGEKLVSLWGFELEISITPPVPVLALEFDELLRFTDVRVPLDRRVWKRVRLVAVY